MEGGLTAAAHALWVWLEGGRKEKMSKIHIAIILLTYFLHHSRHSPVKTRRTYKKRMKISPCIFKRNDDGDDDVDDAP